MIPTLYTKNAKKHPEKQLKLIARSLKEYGREDRTLKRWEDYTSKSAIKL